MDETKFTIITSVILILIILILVRLIYILPCTKFGKHISNPELTLLSSLKVNDNKRKIMILLGSGGHTGEMIRILGQWSKGINKLKREYIITSSDSTSIIKLKYFEKEQLKSIENNDYKITEIYRARNIGEGKLKAIINTLISFKSTINNIIINKLYNQTDIFLTNGPGTAIPIAYMIFILKFFGFCDTKIIYIESLARVKELSLTGFLILPISDRILVQWEPLSKKYKRCEYYGILV
jgi:beta-1,4-N-acetylglucosaminyltransferase